MRRFFITLAGALTLATTAPAQPAPAVFTAGEAKLSAALEGRTPGQPVNCLQLRDVRSSKIIDRTAILYETHTGTLYLNRPRSGQRSLNDSDVLVTRTHSNQLCSVDVVHLYNSSSQVQTGFVLLDKFTPYSRPAAPLAR